MKKRLSSVVRSVLVPAFAVALLGGAVACGGDEPAPQTPPPPPPVDTTPPVATTPPPPPEPTAEEKKKAADAKKLEADKAKAKADNDKETARWTPELHAEGKTLASKDFASGKAAIQAAMAAKTRRPGQSDRDKYRHPAETLDFFGFKPTETVLEFGPGEGWYTSLLAPTLAKKGKLLVTGADPNGPPDAHSTLDGQVFKMFLDSSPEEYSKVELVVIDEKTPKLPMEGTLDLVILARELHGMVQRGTLDGWLAEINKALKPNGTLGIEQHRAPADAKPEESAKNGYLPEKWVIEKIEAAGFKLAGKSEINANPKDTKDYENGVWTLPPNYRLGDKDRDKYAAIGESDRMTLKFTKVVKKDAKPDAKK